MLGRSAPFGTPILALIVALAVAPPATAAQVAAPASAVPSAPAPQAPPASDNAAPGVVPFFRAEDPPGRSLDANLFAQTSAEYRACCLQAYNLSRLRLAAVVSPPPAAPAG